MVFDISDQRVWLVDGADEVLSTYLVSGSVTDNLGPGTYAVYSRSRWAVGIDDSGVMEYFTRFTRGANAAIGFHSIPTKDGRPLQTRGAARDAAEPRVHPSGAAGRQEAVGLRARGHEGRRHRLSAAQLLSPAAAGLPPRVRLRLRLRFLAGRSPDFSPDPAC